jgi:DNA polymerase-3 subunit gamma/tau
MEEKKSYEVIARKWRPRQFDEVVGQEHVTTTLRNAIKLNRVAHAYLFVGPRGIGKTSIARIFAKALNCKEGPTEKPCDKCDSCAGITDGNNFDVREIDGASNRQIDDIRSLREDVKYAPNGRYKIYIIDEVHMLTLEAFNALLKTLEEPPEHVMFLFATTEPQKVPLTILSRCQRFDLRRIPLRLIVERLAMIAKEEKVEIEHDALLAVARAAEGGLRDAESALDQLIAFQGNKISEENVLSVFGLMPRKALEELASAVFKGDIKALVRSVEEMDRQGKDMQRLLLELLDHCRNLLIFLEAGALGDEMDLTEDQLETIKEQAKTVDSGRLLRIIDTLTETTDRLRYALSKKTLLEVTLLRCARAATTVSIDQVIAEVKQLSSMVMGGSHGSERSHLTSPVMAEPQKKEAPRPEETPAARESARETDREQLGGDDLAKLLREWHAIVERAGKSAALARANLVDSMPVKADLDKVTVAFDPEFAERMEQAAMPRNRAALQKALTDFLRRPVAVEFIACRLNQNSSAAKDNPAPAKQAPAPDAPKSGAPAVHSRHKWVSNEAVRKTLDLFDGKIVDIRE